MLNQILRPIARRALQQRGTRLAHDGHHHSSFKYVTMDEACVPQGSWKENNAKRQAKYNAHLIIGLVVFGATITTISSMELLFFNYVPPKPSN